MGGLTQGVGTTQCSKWTQGRSRFSNAPEMSKHCRDLVREQASLRNCSLASLPPPPPPISRPKISIRLLVPLSFQLRKAFLNSGAHRSPPLLAQPFICSKRPPLPSPATNTPPNRLKTNSCSGSCERIYSRKPDHWPAPSKRYPIIFHPALPPALLLLEALQVHWPIFKVSSCNFSPVA